MDVYPWGRKDMGETAPKMSCVVDSLNGRVDWLTKLTSAILGPLRCVVTSPKPFIVIRRKWCVDTRWAPISYKWSYNLNKWPFKMGNWSYNPTYRSYNPIYN